MFLKIPCPPSVSPVEIVVTRDIRIAPIICEIALSARTASTPSESETINGAANSRPKNLAPCLVALLRTSALSRSSLGTWFGIRADKEGSCIALTVPLAKARTAMCQSSIFPVAVIMARRAATIAAIKNVAVVTLRRSNKSPSSPPIGEAMRKGIIAANVVIPTHPDDDEASNTNQELDMMNVHMPAPENIPASQVYRKAGYLSVVNCGRSVILNLKLAYK